MPAHRSCGHLLPGGGVLKDGDRVWRVGHVAGPLEYPPNIYLPDPRSGRFDDPLKEYRTLYCARYQSVALRETLQQFRRTTASLSKLKQLLAEAVLPPVGVPRGWRAKRVLAPAHIRLIAGDLIVYDLAFLVSWRQGSPSSSSSSSRVCLLVDLASRCLKDELGSKRLELRGR